MQSRSQSFQRGAELASESLGPRTEDGGIYILVVLLGKMSREGKGGMLDPIR
jgi:hypothetical protein